MQRRGVGIAAGLVLIGAVSAWFVVQRDPEYTYATSEDGTVTVSGLSRATQEIEVVDAGVPVISAFTSHVYALEGMGTVDVPITVTFRSSTADTVFWFNREEAMWEPLETIAAKDLLSVQTTQLGNYAAGYTETVDMPAFVDELAALRAMAPQGTVGYAITVGYARDGIEEYLRIPGALEQGGCGGALLPGETEARSVRERRAVLLVDDVQTPVTLLFSARWQVTPAGCPELSPFRAADDRGTLPLSP